VEVLVRREGIRAVVSEIQIVVLCLCCQLVPVAGDRESLREEEEIDK